MRDLDWVPPPQGLEQGPNEVQLLQEQPTGNAAGGASGFAAGGAGELEERLSLSTWSMSFCLVNSRISPVGLTSAAMLDPPGLSS